MIVGRIIIVFVFGCSVINAIHAQVLANKVDSVSYSVGTMIVKTLRQQGIDTVNYSMIAKAVKDGMTGDSVLLDEFAASEFLRSYVQARQTSKFLVNKELGEKFLAENAKREGVIVLESGLQYEVIRKGDGTRTPGPDSEVTAHYHGTLIDGTVFDSSVERGEPLQFRVGNVIEGWQEALQKMHVGDKWRLYIPYDLAYGERGAGSMIAPYSTLIFDVELIAIGQ